MENERLTPISAYHIFNDENSPLFFKHYQEYFGTLHTVVYCPESMDVIIGIGGDYNPFELSFDEWLAGKGRLTGMLEGQIIR